MNFDKGTKRKSGKGKYWRYYTRIGKGENKKYKCLYCGYEIPSYSGICSHLQRNNHMKKRTIVNRKIIKQGKYLIFFTLLVIIGNLIFKMSYFEIFLIFCLAGIIIKLRDIENVFQI